MAAELIYAFRVMRLPLLDAGGAPIGRIEDIVVIPGRAGKGRESAIPPRVVGFVANSQRRRIFVNANRIAELDSDGARLRSWDVDLNPFKPRPGEVLIGGELIDRKIGDETVSDIALRAQENARSTYWVIDKVRLARKTTLRRRPSYRLVDFDEVPALFDAQTEMQAEAARLRDFHPAEVAAVVRALPIDQRRQLAEAMDDERLADVLEELPEEEQVRIVERARPRPSRRRVRRDGVRRPRRPPRRDGTGRPGAHARRDGRRRRRRRATPALVRGGHRRRTDDARGDHPRPDATVAEALAQIRDPDWVVSIATQVFVCQAPFKAPTGKLVGVAHMQRLLREPPSMAIGRLVTDDPTVTPDAHRP